MIVKGSLQRFVESLLIMRIPRASKLSSFLILQLKSIELEHHFIRFDVSLNDLRICPKLLGLFLRQRTRVRVESRLEGIREYPLDEGMISFKFFILVDPLLVHNVNELSVRKRTYLVKIELNIDVLRRLRLEFYLSRQRLT